MKIEIEDHVVGCLIEEVDRKRKQVDMLSRENNVMHSFFEMFNRIRDKPSQTCLEDFFCGAKKEFEAAKFEATNKMVSDNT